MHPLVCLMRSRFVLLPALVLLVALALILSCSEDEPPIVVNGVNHAPAIVIESPADSGAEPTEILARATILITITDAEDRDDELSFRWTFVSTDSFGGSWDATEDSILTSPDAFTWSDWNPYAPADTGMAVTIPDSLEWGFYVLAAQARDHDNEVSELGSDNMRRVIAGDGSNDAPVVTIISPPSSAPDPTDVDAQLSFVVRITDADDLASDLMFRWALVRTSEHAQDWDATENYIQTQTDKVAWSAWSAWAPRPDGTMFISVYAPLDNAPYVLTVQARDRNQRASALDAASLRRVRVCAAVNEAPSAIVVIPRYNGSAPAAVPPTMTFHFAAGDFDNPYEELSTRWTIVATEAFDDSWQTTIDYLRGDPDVLTQYGKTLQDVEDEWTDWVPYVRVSGTMAVTMGPLDFGNYIFAVQMRDPCDGVGDALIEARNVRRIRVSNRTTGPLLVVLNPYVGPIHTTVCNTPVVITDILAGVAMQFMWTADATSYGGVVPGYRYGWDILDPDDDSQWEIDWTPFVGPYAAAPPRTFSQGTHTFHVETVDNYGFCSRVEVRLNIIPYAPTRALLVVDDFAADETPGAGWNDPLGKGFAPNDAEHDQFWMDMLADVEGFNPGIDVIEVTGATPIPITTLAQYKNIIWSVYADVGQSSGSLLHEYAKYVPKFFPSSPGGVRDGNPLALFMEAGGHILITGRHTLTTTLNRAYFPVSPRFPFIFLYDQEGNQDRTPRVDNPLGDESFAYHYLSLETMDFAIPSTQTLRNNLYECSVEQARPISGTAVRDDGLRETLPLDPAFPRLDLRVETASPGKAYDPTMRSYESEVYNPMYFYNLCRFATPPRSTFEPIYGLGCLNTVSVNYGMPVAFWTTAFADRVANGGVAARSAVFGFPLVYFDPAQVKQALDYVLFNEWMLPRVP